MDLLRKLAVDQSAAVIAVTHDEKIFDRFDHMFMLRDGRGRHGIPESGRSLVDAARNRAGWSWQRTTRAFPSGHRSVLIASSFAGTVLSHASLA
jgi:hypothetical protein